MSSSINNSKAFLQFVNLVTAFIKDKLELIMREGMGITVDRSILASVRSTISPCLETVRVSSIRNCLNLINAVMVG